MIIAKGVGNALDPVATMRTGVTIPFGERGINQIRTGKLVRQINRLPMGWLNTSAPPSRGVPMRGPVTAQVVSVPAGATPEYIEAARQQAGAVAQAAQQMNDGGLGDAFYGGPRQGGQNFINRVAAFFRAGRPVIASFGGVRVLVYPYPGGYQHVIDHSDQGGLSGPFDDGLGRVRRRAGRARGRTRRGRARRRRDRFDRGPITATPAGAAAVPPGVAPPLTCPPGFVLGPGGQCIPAALPMLPTPAAGLPGYTSGMGARFGARLGPRPKCPTGQVPNADWTGCIPASAAGAGVTVASPTGTRAGAGAAGAGGPGCLPGYVYSPDMRNCYPAASGLPLPAGDTACGGAGILIGTQCYPRDQANPRMVITSPGTLPPSIFDRAAAAGGLPSAAGAYPGAPGAGAYPGAPGATQVCPQGYVPRAGGAGCVPIGSPFAAQPAAGAGAVPMTATGLCPPGFTPDPMSRQCMPPGAGGYPGAYPGYTPPGSILAAQTPWGPTCPPGMAVGPDGRTCAPSPFGAQPPGGPEGMPPGGMPAGGGGGGPTPVPPPEGARGGTYDEEDEEDIDAEEDTGDEDLDGIDDIAGRLYSGNIYYRW